jgi:hypothetical protein
MNYEIINVGELPNDGTGDPVRVAFIKINNNFSGFNNFVDPFGANGAIQFKKITTNGNVSTNSFTASNNFVFDASANTLILNGNISPLTANVMDIGSNAKPVGNIYISSSGLKLGNITISSTANGITFVGEGNTSPVLQSGNVNTVTVNASGAISYGNVPKVTISTFTVETTTNAPNQKVFELLATSLNTIRFDIVSSTSSGNDRQSATVMAVKSINGTVAKYTVHDTIFQGNVVTNYEVTSEFGNIVLKLSPFLNTTISHKISYQMVL